MRAIVVCIVVLVIGTGCDDKQNKHSKRDKRIVDATGTDTVCGLHNVELKEDVVPIIYGLVRHSDEEHEAHKSFPHARSSVNPGCSPVEGEDQARVRFCAACRAAEAKWARTYQEKYALIKDHWDRLGERLRENVEFKQVHVFIQSKGKLTVGLEGSVATSDDLDKLRKLVEATKPPHPVFWDVTVADMK